MYLLVARLSDAYQERGLAVVICGSISVIGYAILISDTSSGVHYFATCLVAIGLYVCVGIPLAWLPANSPRYGKRSTASGLQLTIGNAGGIGAPFYYATKDAPRYIKGHGITLGLVAFGTLLYGALSLYYHATEWRKTRWEGRLQDGRQERGRDSRNGRRVSQVCVHKVKEPRPESMRWPSHTGERAGADAYTVGGADANCECQHASRHIDRAGVSDTTANASWGQCCRCFTLASLPHKLRTGSWRWDYHERHS